MSAPGRSQALVPEPFRGEGSPVSPMPSSAAFERLQAAYRARDEGWRNHDEDGARGRPVVGFTGNTVPREVIDACGALAWRIAPIEGPTTLADAHVETFSDLDARLVFARFCAGALDGLAALVIPRSTEVQHKLYLALREARRTGVKKSGPPLVLYDILHTQRETSRMYGLARTRELADTLAGITGTRATQAALAQAIEQRNNVRAQLARLQQRRREQGLSGWMAQIATGATWFMAPQAAAEALAAWLGEPSPSPMGGPRLLVKGVPLDHAELHALAEACGARIVAEDDDWGARAAEPLVAEGGSDLLTPIFEHHWRGVPCPRIHPQPLASSWFETNLATGGIDGVLFNHARPDDIHGWTFPAERALVEGHGRAWLQLRDDAREPATRLALQAQLRAFIESLSPPA